MAKVAGISLPISTKHSIEICNFIRNKNLSKARDLLKEVIELKKTIPFKRFTGDVGHKKGKIGPGRYPKKASIEIIKLLNTAEANAQFKGLNTSNLVIKHICANKASTPWRYGRQRRRKMKRTHVEIIVEEKASKERKKKETKEVKKEAQEVKENKKETKQEKKTEIAPKESTKKW